MGINFPSSPSVGQLHPVPAVAGVPQYKWDGTVWSVQSGNELAPPPYSRNRIVNGAMQISQEWADVVLTSVIDYPVDQFLVNYAGGAISHHRQGTVTPGGSSKRLRIYVNTAVPSLAATGLIQISQALEGVRVSDFRWGTAQAKQVILRFGFKAPAGVYSCAIMDNPQNRSFVANFTISAGQANTDTEQIIIIPGDTAGTYPTTNVTCFSVRWCMASGSNYIGVAGWQAGIKIATSSNTNGFATVGNAFELFDVGLYLDAAITGVPPKWEMPDPIQELAACQRYYELSFEAGDFGNFYTPTTEYLEMYVTAGVGSFQFLGGRFKTRMRATPTVTVISDQGAAGHVAGVTRGHIECQVSAQSDTGFNLYLYGGNVGPDLMRYNYIANARLL